MSTIEVSAERPYAVRIAAGALTELPELLEGGERVAILHPPVLADRARALAAELPATVSLLQVPDAEAAKTPQVLARCWDRLAADGFTRSDAVVGFGGGATTDLAGFVAATWLRGVRLVTVPTTVLGMVDAAVGGKTGINISAGKNLVGAFHEPAGVLCDLDLLPTLPPADLRAGMAEVIKCGFIADPQILELIEADPLQALDPRGAALAELITRGIGVKATVVSGDLRESTSVGRVTGRELLNYGHTLGHAIERASGYRWRHGEAISVGMAFAAELSHGLGLIDETLVQRHFDLLAGFELPTSAAEFDFAELRQAMSLDKKTRGSMLRFVLLDGLASARIVSGPPEDALVAAWQRLGRR
ncbi:3-dehydroquinate synthase [Naumannella halotolerans]|uniref:3-dehydroquinate synthase n=1 Tax=Naumannella halotolerans TaxID=993414 RepID=A0A4R7JAB2_9ACTN|nr:3-dehydroquinate synthase [Naumannella halotolerans]TDT33483.1 3-dehydroquinate synthase [Naumannella halotolerans]